MSENLIKINPEIIREAYVVMMKGNQQVQNDYTTAKKSIVKTISQAKLIQSANFAIKNTLQKHEVNPEIKHFVDVGKFEGDICSLNTPGEWIGFFYSLFLQYRKMKVYGNKWTFPPGQMIISKLCCESLGEMYASHNSDLLFKKFQKEKEENDKKFFTQQHQKKKEQLSETDEDEDPFAEEDDDEGGKFDDKAIEEDIENAVFSPQKKKGLVRQAKELEQEDRGIKIMIPEPVKKRKPNTKK